MTKRLILKMKNVTKQFHGVRALNSVDFDLYEGEVHVLCGENGAGKSTLMKILAGSMLPTEGEIYLYDKKVDISSPFVSEQMGISIVYQELCLSPSISVAENIFLGREFKNASGLIDKAKMHNEAGKLLKALNCDVHPGTLLRRLDIAKQQLVQIAKAISLNAKILIMDEPFSSLDEEDTNNLFRIMENLREKGVSIVYIDHRIENFFRIGDRVTVLRDGKLIKTASIEEFNKEIIINHMVGRNIDAIYPERNKVSDEVVIRVSNLINSKIKDISFEVRKGEIFGIGGLVGAGRTEIVKAIIGRDKIQDGKVFINGHERKIKSPSDALKYGVGYVPEDRKLDGLFLKRSVKFNSSLACIEYFRGFMLINSKKEKGRVNEFIKSLNIRTPSINKEVKNLSGGNQQKVVLAKSLMMNNLQVLILDEPTRGIDVGAKFEIYRLINSLASQGIAIILITSELPELLGLCHRIGVVKDGKMVAILDDKSLTAENVMACCV
jgi:ribose transport system ATP-binding protein